VRRVPGWATALDYDGVHLGCGYRADIIVNNEVVLEVKPVAHVLPLHEVQLLIYLRPCRCRVGLLRNFNMLPLKDGIRRRVVRLAANRLVLARPASALRRG